MMFIMWVYLETWIVQDGAAELGRGSYLPGVGLRADCLSLAPPRAPADGVAELADRGGRQRPGSHVHELTGTAGPAWEVHAGEGPGQRDVCWEFVLTAADQAFIARTTERAALVAAGSRVTARCILSVVADYEWDAFGLPDLRSDWHVRRLRIEHRQKGDAPGGPGQAVMGHPGEVLRSFEIEKMSRWDDDRDSTIRTWYVLDLTPGRPGP